MIKTMMMIQQCSVVCNVLAMYTICILSSTQVWSFPMTAATGRTATNNNGGWSNQQNLLSMGIVDDDEDCSSSCSSMIVERRGFVVASLSAFSIMNGLFGNGSPVVAEEVGSSKTSSLKSSKSVSTARGPVELLRPATRVRMHIDSAIDMCRSIKQSAAKDNLTKDDIRTKYKPLSDFLLPERSFILPDELKLSRTYLEIDTTTPWQAARLKEQVERGKERGIDYDTPYDKVNTAIQQWGDRRQFETLRNRQLNLEKKNEIRAALNAYTNNIIFSDSYKLNADGDNKKALVRNDALPDVNAVVVSDLDLRDLYRNQILQSIDDAKFELTYQLKQQNEDDIDVDEILNYLVAAQDACNEWFSFIPSDDVDVARRAVLASQWPNK